MATIHLHQVTTATVKAIEARNYQTKQAQS